MVTFVASNFRHIFSALPNPTIVNIEGAVQVAFPLDPLPPPFTWPPCLVSE